MTQEQSQAILQAATQLAEAYDNLRAHDVESVLQYQYRPTYDPKTGQHQASYAPQPQERKDHRKKLIVIRRQAERELNRAVEATCRNQTVEEARAEKFGK